MVEKFAPTYVPIIHILLHTPSHPRNWLKKSCQSSCPVPYSSPCLSPPSPFRGSQVIRGCSQIASKRGLTAKVPTYPFAPAHMTSAPGSTHSLQASTSLPTQQGRTGQTPGLHCDWHAISLQGKCPGNFYCQNLGNKQ